MFQIDVPDGRLKTLQVKYALIFASLEVLSCGVGTKLCLEMCRLLLFVK